MKKITYLLLAMPCLFCTSLFGQSLLEDAKALQQLLKAEEQAVTFEIFPWEEPCIKTYLDRSKYEQFVANVEEGDIIWFKKENLRNKEYSVSMKWLVKGDSLLLLENKSNGIAKKRGFKIPSLGEAEKSIKFFITEGQHTLYIALDEQGIYKNINEQRLEATSYVLKIHRDSICRVIPKKGVVIDQEAVSPYDNFNINLIKKEPVVEVVYGVFNRYADNAERKKVENPAYNISYLNRDLSPYYIKFWVGSKAIKTIPINPIEFSFEHDKDRNEIFVQSKSQKKGWQSLDIPTANVPFIIKSIRFRPKGFLANQYYLSEALHIPWEKNPAFNFKEDVVFQDLLEEYNSHTSGDGYQLDQAFVATYPNFQGLNDVSVTLKLVNESNRMIRKEIPLTKTINFTIRGNPKNLPYLVNSEGEEYFIMPAAEEDEGILTLAFTEFTLPPLVYKKGTEGIYDFPIKFLLKDDGLDFYGTTDYIDDSFSFPIVNQKENQLLYLLGKHSLLNQSDLKRANLTNVIKSSYSSNRYLNTILDRNLSSGLSNGLSYTENKDLQKKLTDTQQKSLFSTPLNNLDLLAESATIANYRTPISAVLESYRTPIVTAVDNLQLASQQFENKSKRLQKGFSATTIAAGLSDFIVERAQEELNLTFLERLRSGILNDTSEFKILFPQSRDMLVDFKVAQYQTQIDFARTSFVQDLRNLGLNFPKLFELSKYEKLKNDPTVFNIFLIYDIANQIYEDTPIEQVLSNLHTRLDERHNSLNQSINLSLATAIQENTALQDSMTTIIASYTAKLANLDQEIETTKEIILGKVEKMKNNSGGGKEQVTQIDNFEIEFKNNISPNFKEVEGLGEEKYLLQDGKEEDPNLIFQQYQTLAPRYLHGDPVYWYALDKLSLASSSTFFNQPLVQQEVVATGVNLIREMLVEETQESQRQTWISTLEKGLAETEKIHNTITTYNYETQLKELKGLMAKRAAMNIGLELELSFWEQLKIQYPNQVTEHDYQAIKYLKDVLSNNYGLFNWSDLDGDNEQLGNTGKGIGFFYDGTSVAQTRARIIDSKFNRKLAKGNQFLNELSDKIQARVTLLQSKNKQLVNEFSVHAQTTNHYYQAFLKLPALTNPVETIDYAQLMDTMQLITKDSSQSSEDFLTKQETSNEFTTASFQTPLNKFIKVCDELPIQQQVSSYAVSNELSYRNIEKRIALLKTDFQKIAIEKEQLRQEFDALENKRAEKLYKAREHSDQLTLLTELTTHILYALKENSQLENTISIQDSTVQQIKRIQMEGNNDRVEITYDSLVINSKEIASGKMANKWMKSNQLIGISTSH